MWQRRECKDDSLVESLQYMDAVAIGECSTPTKELLLMQWCTFRRLEMKFHLSQFNPDREEEIIIKCRQDS